MKRDKKDIKQYKNLTVIKKPAPATEDTPQRSILMVYWEIESLYNTDYNLTIEEIMNILKCSRGWIEKIICKEVKYIDISQKIYNILYSICWRYEELDINFIKKIGKAKYFFSREDFFNWLLKNTVAERQTIVIDLKKYTDNIEAFDKALEEVKKADVFQRELKINKLYNTLNKEGKKLISKRVYSDKRSLVKAKKLKLESVDDIPKMFISIKVLKNIYKNNESAYRYLFKAGYIKYTIYDSIVRFDAEYKKVNGEYPITVDYNIYDSLNDNLK